MKLRSWKPNLTFTIEDMETINNFVFFHSLFTTLLLAGLCFVIAKRVKSEQILHLAELWLSLALMIGVSYFTQSKNDNIVAISLLGWIWPLKAILQMIQDLSGVTIFLRPKVIVVSVGAFLTMAFISYGFPFQIYTLPFCLSVGVVGVMLSKEVYKKIARKNFSILGHSTFFFLGLFFLVEASFPFWRLSEYQVFGVSAYFVALMGIGVTALAYNLELMKNDQEEKLEGVLKERNDQLFGQSKYSELGMMSAGIAHEINNPLAIIQAKTTQLLRILRNPERQQEVSDGLEQILYTSERINRTIQGVRDFVHQDDRVPDEEFTAKHLVDDVMAFCGQRMKNHGVNLRFYGLENCTLQGHKIQLEQVLLNLLNNSFDAIEFLPDKWIEMSVHDKGRMTQIYFKDSGSGIPPEVASRIMEPFYTTKDVGKGTGLGLALARGIVEKHGGSLTYVSNVRHTTFLLELPKVEEKSEYSAPRRKSSENSAFHH